MVTEIRSQNPMIRNGAERMAQNMPTQGLQADIIKLAMIQIAQKVLVPRRRRCAITASDT